MSKPAGTTGRPHLFEIIDLLPDLPVSALRSLQIAIEQELDKHIEIDRELYHLVFEVVGEKPIAISKFNLSTNAVEWRRNVSAFTDLEKKLHGASPPRKGVQLALRKFLIELLIEDIKAKHKPVTLKNVCIQLGQMQGAFDRHFPGYLKNGWGGVVISQLGGRHDSTKKL